MLVGVALMTFQAKGDRAVKSLKREERPRVDVFVTYCGEGHDIVLNTARAACALDWPSGAYRVVIPDENNSAELSKKIGELSKKVSPLLVYASRGAAVRTHSKAEQRI